MKYLTYQKLVKFLTVPRKITPYYSGTVINQREGTMTDKQLRKLEAAGIDPDYITELYDHLASEWARKAEAARKRRSFRRFI